jgi:hypothetical protein
LIGFQESEEEDEDEDEEEGDHTGLQVLLGKPCHVLSMLRFKKKNIFTGKKFAVLTQNCSSLFVKRMLS